VLAYYVHDLSPFLIQFTEKIGIRWYGLAYVLGFLAVYMLIRMFIRRKYYNDIKESQLADFITYGAIFGVMIGGRLGYMLFYNWSEFSSNPLIFFKFLDGGMSSHGGILGLVIFTWVYAWKNRISWTGIGDQLCTAAPIALCFGRLANFINGELYGRATQAWCAMQFPEEIRDPAFKFGDVVNREVAPLMGGEEFTAQQVIDASRDSPEIRQILGEYLTPRHPSQLYQAALEGLSLLAILLFVRLRFRNVPNGVLTGLFFIFYAIFRIIGEQFREPESGMGPFGVLTKGQFLSTFMIGIGLVFIVWAVRARRRE
jgi:phosphatidylglycerol:prolipoprotein diacylglycerol transferase